MNEGRHLFVLNFDKRSIIYADLKRLSENYHLVKLVGFSEDKYKNEKKKTSVEYFQFEIHIIYGIESDSVQLWSNGCFFVVEFGCYGSNQCLRLSNILLSVIRHQLTIVKNKIQTTSKRNLDYCQMCPFGNDSSTFIIHKIFGQKISINI